MIIAAITITTERAEQVLFSNAYLNAGQVIIVNEFNQNISIPDDLENKSVGVQSGTTSEAEALKYTNSSLVKVYDHYLEARADLIAGEIDAIIIDYPAGLGLIKNISGLKIVGEPFTDELYGIAVKKGEQALKTEIDDLIASSEIKELEAKWF
jgi:polar amino acid transport system substrate-binding protein